MSRKQAHKSSSPRGSRRALLLAATATLLLLVGVASAGAATSIVGVWSFGGGQIAVQPEGNGKFEGVVVAPTTFAECIHPAGQKIWSQMTAQADGSFWGFHQWYFASAACVPNPTLGPTAWRVEEERGGASFLRICFSEPGQPQPTIPPGSAGIGASRGCQSSALIAPLNSVASSKERLSLPSAKKCLSARLFQIHLAEPAHDPFKTVHVTIAGHKIATKRRGNFIVATVNLKGLKKGKFTLTIHATTVLGHHLSGSRAYHTCAKKAKTGKPSKLH
jgi:hypothetical protein